MFSPQLQRVPQISGDDDEDTALLLRMAEEARAYISSFSWCPPIDAMYLGVGVGGIVAIFLVELSQRINATDKELWVVVGDLPSAYMAVDDDETATEALEKYCELMDQWIAAVRTSGDLDDVFPVEAEPTRENADALQSRIGFLRNEIIAE